MVRIAIRDELIRSVEKLAQDQGTDAESLVNAWIERELALAREQRIREESARFRTQHSALHAAYAGEYVAMRDGQVLDHDPDVQALYLRMHERFGDEPILIAPVTETPDPTYNMRSPRLAGPDA
jgi:hypothetical protein